METTDEIDVEDDEDLYSNVVNKVESREESQQQMIISEVRREGVIILAITRI